ncbi:hypothetical protein ADUPG1_002223 [Aduncisulcus paluster]|uniref:Uncharacterized protein n=1 Tax=Aduncisulcus paluster TaxID=2918883 RepID=A0ABQ5KKY2_9EUKA|nr:hypothetical protein ADUPG1_002223 [Aduncisulcus paluster]
MSADFYHSFTPQEQFSSCFSSIATSSTVPPVYHVQERNPSPYTFYLPNFTSQLLMDSSLSKWVSRHCSKFPIHRSYTSFPHIPVLMDLSTHAIAIRCPGLGSSVSPREILRLLHGRAPSFSLSCEETRCFAEPSHPSDGQYSQSSLPPWFAPEHPVPYTIYEQTSNSLPFTSPSQLLSCRCGGCGLPPFCVTSVIHHFVSDDVLIIVFHAKHFAEKACAWLRSHFAQRCIHFPFMSRSTLSSTVPVSPSPASVQIGYVLPIFYDDIFKNPYAVKRNPSSDKIIEYVAGYSSFGGIDGCGKLPLPSPECFPLKSPQYDALEDDSSIPMSGKSWISTPSLPSSTGSSPFSSARTEISAHSSAHSSARSQLSIDSSSSPILSPPSTGFVFPRSSMLIPQDSSHFPAPFLSLSHRVVRFPGPISLLSRAFLALSRSGRDGFSLCNMSRLVMFDVRQSIVLSDLEGVLSVYNILGLRESRLKYSKTLKEKVRCVFVEFKDRRSLLKCILDLDNPVSEAYKLKGYIGGIDFGAPGGKLAHSFLYIPSRPPSVGPFYNEWLVPSLKPYLSCYDNASIGIMDKRREFVSDVASDSLKQFYVPLFLQWFGGSLA